MIGTFVILLSQDRFESGSPEKSPKQSQMLESLFNKVTNSFFYRTPPVASVDLLFLIKNNMVWFLLKRFVDMVKVRYFHIISRNHSNTLLLISSDIRILTV